MEAHAVGHVLGAAGLDVRLGLGHPVGDETACSGVVLVAVDATALGTDVAAVRAALRSAPMVVLAREDVLEAGSDVGAVAALPWQEPTERVVEVVRDLVGGVLDDATTAASRTGSPRTDASLTRRELQIAGLLAGGWRNEEIARELGISAHTVRTHVSRVLGKLGVQHRVALAVKMRHDPSIPGPRRPRQWHMQDSRT
jgi:DNA-binding NarL/FixJ family response regulator